MSINKKGEKKAKLPTNTFTLIKETTIGNEVLPVGSKVKLHKEAEKVFRFKHRIE